jgi:hypothetical protein
MDATATTNLCFRARSKAGGSVLAARIIINDGTATMPRQGQYISSVPDAVLVLPLRTAHTVAEMANAYFYTVSRPQVWRSPSGKGGGPSPPERVGWACRSCNGLSLEWSSGTAFISILARGRLLRPSWIIGTLLLDGTCTGLIVSPLAG